MPVTTLDMVADERLAELPLPKLDESFGPEDMKRIAKLAYLISRKEQKKHGAPVGAAWEHLSDAQREMSARGVLRVVQAMVLIGWIAPP